jgi:glycosyltransferase involved in cell wall biosynthesis
MKKKQLSVVIPFFNEQDELLTLFLDLIKFEENNGDCILEYLFINDASTDNSLKIITNLKNKTSKKIKKKVKILNNKKNLGWAKTVERGYKKAIGGYVLYIPGDGEAKLTKVLKKNFFFNKKEVILIQRASMPGRRPISRILITYVYRFLISLIFSTKMIDFNGLIILKKDIIKKLNISSNSFFISAEIIVKSFRLGLNVDYMNSFQFSPKNNYKSTSLNFRQFIKILNDIFITLKFIRSIK